MLKTKQRRFAIVAILMFMMIAMYGGMPTVNAASMDSAKVTLGDSDLSAVSTATVVFDLGTTLATGDYVTVAFHADFSTIAFANATCPSDATESGAGDSITCTAVTPLSNGAPLTLSVTGVTNPGVPDDYSVTITSYTSGAAVIESSETKVYIIDDVTVTAHVAATLTFAVTGTSTDTTINGDVTTGTTSATAIDFETLPLNTEQIMAQQLKVSTNADAGFTVTVQQNHNMESAAGADIDSFNIAAPANWALPAINLADDATFGQMGVASDDSNLSTAFNDGFYRGLDGITPLEVMSHGGSADGATPDAGWVNVAYNIQITDLQEAGDYDNTLTYVCTPTF